MKLPSKYSTLSVLIVGTLLGSLFYLSPKSFKRELSSKDQFELHLQKMSLHPLSRLLPQENIYLRTTFNKLHEFNYGKDQTWNLDSGTSIDLDMKIDIDPTWIENDQLEFKIEIVKKVDLIGNVVEVTVINCATISRELSEYNRGYQCYVPGEKHALLTYRLSKKGELPPGNQRLIGQNSSSPSKNLKTN